MEVSCLLMHGIMKLSVVVANRNLQNGIQDYTCYGQINYLTVRQSVDVAKIVWCSSLRTHLMVLHSGVR